MLQLYDQLVQINSSPAVVLNRIYALFKVKGAEVALREMETIQMPYKYFYYTLFGELYLALDPARARLNFEQALQLAKTQLEKDQIMTKLSRLSSEG